MSAPLANGPEGRRPYFRRRTGVKGGGLRFGNMPLDSRQIAKGTESDMSLVEEVARKLGGKAVLGRSVRSQADLALAVQARLPLATLEGLVRAGFGESEIDRLVIPPRTRRHRAEKQQPLTVEESDRAVRLLRLQTLAEATFGDRDKAAAWLRHPLAVLDGETPLDVACSEAGARVIETILAKIAWGAAA
ncbi:antitoxin Xre/MbcA/ParS toxin-binding domain-containing protein [Rhodoplanes azumiensis]|uniref:Antitoxin Xre/MbcA/ParS toxin-binding domain-containing protein n=1 Tax=Rhodoplanes azumiensis TaxID=1897628 RepID=A0ABW5AK74_9BRAD